MTEKSELIAGGPPSYPGIMAVQGSYGRNRRSVEEPESVPEESAARPQNYLGLTFFALLCCCCWPAIIFAIVGFIFSVQVDSQYTNKDYLGANRSSYLARNWSIAAIATGLITILIYFAIRLVCHLLEYGEDKDGSGHDMD